MVDRVVGPVVEAVGMSGAAMLELVEVGPAGLPGEVIALEGDRATIQVYEYTGGLSPGQTVTPTGAPLMAELGPGLLGGVFDGMLRPLGAAGDMIEPAVRGRTLDRRRRWAFAPLVRPGDRATPGGLLGSVAHDGPVEGRVLVPPDVGGPVDWIAPEGEFGVDDRIAVVGGRDLTLAHRWPVRRPRPIAARLRAAAPLVSGQRVLDLLFPIAHGGTAAVPGGFGTGKTMLLQQIAKWSDADAIVYVGCGERGNELADVLDDLGRIEDPRTGRPLRDRTIVVANTSNMPVMAREASIHTGACVAEFLRDQGHDAVLIADSTSRWAEALREVASRTGQLPAEEGYPAGLAAELAAFYERASRVRTLAGADASVTILGAVSPPASDMAEPVTAYTRRFVRAVWSLDRDLAYARHYPAVSWTDSSSRDAERVAAWQADNGDPEWGARRARALTLLAEADRVEAVAQLVGRSALPDRERIVLLGARLLRDGVLQQSALSPRDSHSTPSKDRALLRMALDVYERCLAALERGVPAAEIEAIDVAPALHARDAAGPDDAGRVEAAGRKVVGLLEALA
jgi:V/A-type H+-transporting ATPase subunit A